MKKIRLYAASIITGALIPNVVLAKNSLSANITLASDYVADGVSVSDSKPALQGGLDYQHNSGIYAGIWSSNVDSDEPDTPNLELDYSAGLISNLTDHFAYDIGATYYTYHTVDNRDEWNYLEWYTGMTVLENTKLYYYYADDEKVWDGIQRRYILEHTQPLPGDFALLLTAEHVGLETSIGDDYEAYRVGVSKHWFDMDFTVSYWDNTIDHGDNNTKDRFVLEISRNFDLMNTFGDQHKEDHDHL